MGVWRLLVGLAGLALVIHAAIPALSAWRRGAIVQGENWDLEAGDLSGWTRAGDAFAHQPTLDDNPRARERESAQQQGHWWIGGFEDYQGRPWQQPGSHGGDGATGTLTSRPFRIAGDRLTFLIGGGHRPWMEPDGTGATAVNLVVGGKVVRSATGDDSESMRRQVWDVSDLRGLTAVVQVVDHNSEAWGHINFDDLRQLSRWDAERGDLLLALWTGSLLLLIGVGGARLWRAPVAVTGLVIFAMSVPHDAPWQMRLVNGDWADGRLSITALSDPFTLSTGAVAGCAAAVLAALVCASPAARTAAAGLRRQPRRLARLSAALGYLGLTLIPSRYGWWIVDYLMWGSLGLTLVFIGAAPRIDRLLESPAWRRLQGRRDAMPWRLGAWELVALFLLVCAAANLGSYVLFDHLPHIEDSIAQFFHAKIFLLGNLTAPGPEPAEPFEFPHVINNGRWYSMYLPGHSALLALGHLVRAPWLVNPVVGGLCVVVLYFLGREIYGERIARLATLLGALSPFLLFMSSEFMNHTTTLLAVELFLLGFARLIHRGRAADALLTGAALGYALLIRPLTAVAVAAPFAVYAVGRWVRALNRRLGDARRQAALYLLALAVFGVTGGGVLAFNYLTNGDPFLFGYIVRYGEGHALGFGHSGWGDPHSPHDGVVQTLNNLNALNKYLFEWPIPSLLFAVLALAAPRANVWDVLLAAYPLSLAAAYFFYWFQDWCFGPRFLFESLAGLVLLTARGITAMPDIMQELFGIGDGRRVRGWMTLIVISVFVLGWASNLPALVRLYGNNYWNVNAKLLEGVHKQGLDNAVVLVRSSYGSAFSANDPLLRSPVIYARDLGPAKNTALMRRFPDREFYTTDGKSLIRLPRSEGAAPSEPGPPVAGPLN